MRCESHQGDMVIVGIPKKARGELVSAQQFVVPLASCARSAWHDLPCPLA